MTAAVFILLTSVLAVCFGYPDIITRDQWGALPATKSIPDLQHPVDYAVIHHTASSSCSSIEACKTYVANTQKSHMANTNVSKLPSVCLS